MVYSCIKEMGLSNRNRNNPKVIKFQGEKDTVDIFLHKLSTVTLSPPGRLGRPSEPVAMGTLIGPFPWQQHRLIQDFILSELLLFYFAPYTWQLN